MSRHPRADAYRKDRELGMTYQQIADKHGVSRQTVAEACGRQGYQFRHFTKERCVYPFLRQWLNENKVSTAEFIRRMGCCWSGSMCLLYSNYFKGKTYPSKQVIDRMLKVTGLTYEQLFYREDDDNGTESV